MSEMILRPYQTEAIEQVRARLRAGAKRVLIVLPTGGGKTVVASDIIRSAVGKGSRVLFLAHRRELIQQTADKLQRFGVRHGIIMAGERPALQHACQVASVQTLARRRDVLKSVDLIFFDEAHHAAASSYTDVLEWFPAAKVVGLTATPWRLDGKGLGDVFDAHVIASTPRELKEQGFLVPVGGWEFEAIDTSRARVQRGDYAVKDLAAEAAKPRVVGDIVEEWLHHAEGKRTVVFCVSIETSQLVAQKFREAGVTAEHVDGEMPTAERDAVLRRLRSGETRVVCNCNVLTEGFDCLDSQTEILTAQGWRGMGGVKEGDLVYSLNRETGAMELTPAEAYVERSVVAGERMLELKSQHANIRTTEGHEFHVKYRNPGNGGALSENFITLTGAQLASRRSAYALPLSAKFGGFKGVPLSDDQLRFIAWFMTDGGFDRTDVTIAQSKPYWREIRALLARLGFDFKERVRPPGHGFPTTLHAHIFRVPRGTHPGMPRKGWDSLAPYLDKNVSPLLHEMSREQFSVFWEELLKGDGNRTGWLWCDRKEQADAYTQLAVLRGFAVSFSEQTTAAGKTMYVVSARDKQWLTSDPVDKRAAHPVLVEPSSDERVWCVRNRNSTLVTRRGGKVAIIGNCPELEVCVLARPTLSTALYLQMVGRVLRPAPGKVQARIHDHSGCLAAHGAPFAARDYSPESSVRGEREPKLDADTRKRNVCPSCKSVRSGYPCDNCGFSPTPEELRIEFEEAAHARAIVEENSPEELKRKEMAKQFRGRTDAERRDFFERMVVKHGPKKAIGVYRWWSGETAWPPREWRQQLEGVAA